ncbi:MAG: IPT/TIG domain-containing protein [Treponema sp.]|nr:IPT/TIG domain-containing protein [Treponema sp.]
MTNKYFLIIVLAAAPVLFLNSCGSESPLISSIDPKIGVMGEFITLTGSGFGNTRDDSSYVMIAGISPTNSSYSLWQDNLIIVRVPELGESGLVYVHVRGKKSNGVLFTNTASVPRPVDGENFGLGPRITSVNPQSGAPGSIITITGNNFGVTRENTPNSVSGVFFSWDFESSSFNPFAVNDPDFIEVSEIELGYESWSSREIRVRLPDGAVSGSLEVRTIHGRSRPVYFDITGKPGTKFFKDRRIYTVSYSADIRVNEATRPNTLYLWMPRPIISSSQRNVRLISRNTYPFLENHKGVSLYKLDNLLAGSSHSIDNSYRVEVYAVESNINPQSIRQITTPLSVMYTQNTDLIPSDNQQIRTTVNSIIGREQNPYIKTRVIYNWIIENIQITDTTSSPVNLVTALEQRRADSYTTMLLFVTMTRAAGVPCIPIAGVLINQTGHTTRHFWAEFWIDGFGWIPVDVVMGAGALQHIFQSMNITHEWYVDSQQPGFEAIYYFGNLDNQRIAFSRGEYQLFQMENRGRIVSHPQSYSLQNIWEEAAGGLESYTSLWGDIIISGTYAQ